ncbi:MAG TPA: amino acid transporter [Dehalococcoidia bacterium]
MSNLAATTMPAGEVLRVLDALSHAGITAWLDGGWGVDALLGEQTRPHSDLDLVIALADSDAARRALLPHGYSRVSDLLPVRFVVGDDAGHRIDFHTVAFDAEGGGLQPQPDGSTFRYPPEGFGATGLIGGEAVRCLSAETQLLCHQGYEPDDDDRHDVHLLAERFGLPLPKAYAT